MLIDSHFLTSCCQRDSHKRNLVGDKFQKPIARGIAPNVFNAPGPGRVAMSRRVKEYVDVEDHVSIDELIEKLAAIRDALPENSDAELRLRGDEVFGRRITISYFRAQTE